MTRGSILLSLLSMCLPSAGAGQGGRESGFELVESIPVETSLDNPDVRNTSEVWLEMIEGARHKLDIEEFYISNKAGEPLDTIIQAIRAAGSRGVAVRVIVDSKMYQTYPETADLLGKSQNIRMRTIDYAALAGGVQHAKFFVVDDNQAFLGSQNFDWRSLKHIHELGVRIRHEQAVRVYHDLFELDWALAGGASPPPVANTRYPVPFRAPAGGTDTIVFTPTCSPIGLIFDTMLWDEREIVDLIDGARTDVSCQFLTYSPVGRNKRYYPVLDNALRRAAARGVRVRMVVSDWSKERPLVDYLKSLAAFPNIEVRFSVIPDWSGGYIPFSRVEHCKYLVVDSSRSWVGTANWERSYFYNTRNVGVRVDDRPFTLLLRRIFFKGWDGPYTEEVRPETEYRPRRHGG